MQGVKFASECMQEGLAHLCLVGAATTLQKAKVEMSMPRKRGAAAAGFDTAYKNFLDRVSHIDIYHDFFPNIMTYSKYQNAQSWHTEFESFNCSEISVGPYGTSDVFGNNQEQLLLATALGTGGGNQAHQLGHHQMLSHRGAWVCQGRLQKVLGRGSSSAGAQVNHFQNLHPFHLFKPPPILNYQLVLKRGQ